MTSIWIAARSCVKALLVVGLSVGVGLSGCTPDPAPDTAALVPAVERASGVSLVVLDLERDSVLVAVRPDVRRPVPGLTALVTALAAEGISPEALQVLRPASLLNSRRLPGLEPVRQDTGAWSLDRLLDAALMGDRAAGDEALERVGRRAAEASAPSQIEAPVPVGGLLLAWAPARRGSEASPDDLAAAFAVLPRPAQRDSAFSRDRAFLNSRATRAAETMRLERGGLGLSSERYDAMAEATLPSGSARSYARLLADHPVLRERLADLSGKGLPARTAAGSLGAFGAAASLSSDGRRIGVLLWDASLGLEDPPSALSARLRKTVE